MRSVLKNDFQFYFMCNALGVLFRLNFTLATYYPVIFAHMVFNYGSNTITWYYIDSQEFSTASESVALKANI